MREVDYQNKWSIKIWYGVLAEGNTGPFMFTGNLNGDTFFDFLRSYLPTFLGNVFSYMKMLYGINGMVSQNTFLKESDIYYALVTQTGCCYGH